MEETRHFHFFLKVLYFFLFASEKKKILPLRGHGPC